MTMKFKKLLFLVVLTVLISISVNAWWNTGHQLATTLAYQNMTTTTKNAVNAILNKQIFSPGPVKCTSGYPAYIMTAVAPWADSVKGGYWDPEIASDFYYNVHFIDSILYFNKDNPGPPSKRVEQAIIASMSKTTLGKPDNIVTAFCDAIVTLKSTHSTAVKKAFALRYIAHLAGGLDSATTLYRSYIS